MADEEQSTPGMLAGLMEEYFARLRVVTDALQNLTGFSPHVRAAPGGFPLPGALSAAQLNSITEALAAQRRSIEALTAQLSSFDEQLKVLEQLLGPLAEWSSRWAEFEERLLNLPRGPETGDPGSRSLRRRAPPSRLAGSAGLSGCWPGATLDNDSGAAAAVIPPRFGDRPPGPAGPVWPAAQGGGNTS